MRQQDWMDHYYHLDFLLVNIRVDDKLVSLVTDDPQISLEGC